MTIRLTRWFFFLSTFYVLHIAFCCFRLFLAIAFAWKIETPLGDDVLTPVFFLIVAGLVSGVKFAIGYSLIETLVVVDRESPTLWNRYHPVTAAFLAFISLLIGISLPAKFSSVSDSLSDSYLGFIFRLQWAPVLLGVMSSALVTAAGTVISWHRRRCRKMPAPPPNGVVPPFR